MTSRDVVLEATGLDDPISRATDDTALATRAAIGLPLDCPIVATGHQPMLHHGGLLAKDMAAHILAQRCAGVAAHLMLDTSADAVFGVDVPECVDGRWGVRRGIVADESSISLWRRPPAVIRAGGAIDITVPDDANAMTQATSLLQWQWDRVGLAPMLVHSASLLGTPGGAGMLKAMADDPTTCAATLAAALDSERIDDMRRPEVGEDPELPLWASLAEDASNRRMARASDLDRDDIIFEPRAVLTSALMRLFVCDRFIHGTGGGRYDRATTRWLCDWLDVEPPAPVVVTAHVRIDADAWLQVHRDIERARAEVRQARHDVGEGAPSQVKATMLDAIESAPVGSRKRRNAFDAMHVELALHAPDRVAAAEATLDAAIEQAQVLRRRDWPLVALSPDRTASLWKKVSEIFY